MKRIFLFILFLLLTLTTSCYPTDFGDFAPNKASQIKVSNFSHWFDATASKPVVQSALEQLSASYPVVTPAIFLKLDCSNDPLTGVELDAGSADIKTKGDVLVYDPAGTDYISINHDGTDGIIGTNTGAIDFIPGTVAADDANINMYLSALTDKGLYIDGTTTDYIGTGVPITLNINRDYKRAAGITNSAGIQNYLNIIHTAGTLSGLDVAYGIINRIDNDATLTNNGAGLRAYQEYGEYAWIDSIIRLDTANDGAIGYTTTGIKSIVNSAPVYTDSHGGAPATFLNAKGLDIDIDTAPTLTSGVLTTTASGIYIDMLDNGVGTSTGYGIYINAITGYDTNYAVYDNSGRLWQLGTSNLATTGTITGINVTSGVDPGHTHTGGGGGSAAEVDTLYSVVSRGNIAGGNISASGIIVTTGGATASAVTVDTQYLDNSSGGAVVVRDGLTVTGIITGNLTGNVTGNAGTVTVADAGGDTSMNVALWSDASGSLAGKTDAGLTFNANTNALTFLGDLINANAFTLYTTGPNDDIVIDANSGGAADIALGVTGDADTIHLFGIVTADGTVNATTFVGALTGTASGNLTSASIDTSAELLTIIGDEQGTGVAVFNNSPIFADDIQLGLEGADGILKIYSEQGVTDYTASLYANTAMTSATSFYLPADEPAGTYLLNMTIGGVIGFDTSAYLISTSIDTSAELYGILTDETGSASGTPLAVFNVNPVLTGATLAGILADNDDMVFECDANNDGTNSYSFTDGASTEIANLSEAGNLQIDGDLTVSGDDIQLGATGVKITDDTDGAITFLGSSTGADEDLRINLDDTANVIVMDSSTAATELDWLGTSGSAALFGLGSTGVLFQDDADGALTITGRSAGYDESLTFNFDDVENTVGVTSGSGVTVIDWGSIGADYDSATVTLSTVVGAIDAGGATTLEIPNGTTDATLTSAGQTHLNTTDEQLSFHSGADGEISGEASISLLRHITATFDPAGYYDQETAYRVLPLFTVGEDAPEGIQITEWKMNYVGGNPTTELDCDLMCDTTPDYNPAAGATVMDVVDTTAGASTATTGFDSATCAHNANVYLRFGADPTDANVVVAFDLWFYNEED